MQPGSKICWRIRNTAKTKQGSSHPHLAKPPAEQAPSRGAKSKKPMAAKMRPKRARTQRYTAAPRGTVRGKPAHATGAFPTLAPALVRRRPRRTSRRAKRPSPQPCCDVDRGVSVAFYGVEAPCSLQNESRRWRKWGAKFGGASRRWRMSRRWRAGGVGRWWRRPFRHLRKVTRGLSWGEGKRPSNAAPRNRQSKNYR